MPTATDVPTIALNDGEHIPQLGFGVFQVPPEDTVEATLRAFETGYRHIDTAMAYKNEAEVGQAFRASGLDRDDVYITTKCFNTDHGFDKAQRAFKESLEKLELDFVDLYLIHWPVPSTDLYVETWKAFIELKNESLIRSIGVSNFNPPHLRRIIDETGVTPAINQVELHPYFQQQGLRREHEDLGIVTEAWSPIAQGKILDDTVLSEIAAEHGKSVAQVALRWHVQIGNVVFPKSVTEERVQENFDIWDFHLTDEELGRIEEIDAGDRIGPDPDTFVAP